jgi:L-asparaginase
MAHSNKEFKLTGRANSLGNCDWRQADGSSSNWILNQFFGLCKSPQKKNQMNGQLWVLGTGGTIAGTAASSSDHTGYTAAQIGVVQLMDSVPGLDAALHETELKTEQIAQLDSKDMDFATMARLAMRCEELLKRDEIRGIVITHGTDTLEETAYFLHRVISPALLARKAVVMTCAMRPATSSEADGPRNLHDAVVCALAHEARGVQLACAGRVLEGAYVTKVHSHDLDAFSEQKWQFARIQPAQYAIKNVVNRTSWPRVDIIMNHASQGGEIVRALLDAPTAQPLKGIVIAATGNGTISATLEAALLVAQGSGVLVWRSTRTAFGSVRPTAHDKLPCTPLPPVKARIEMVLQLLALDSSSA